MQRADALARFSELAGGVTRVSLSPEQRAANEAVLGWMREAGMRARLDAVGNCVGRYEGERDDLPCLMIGSHLDTVRDAGRYDGILGVLAGIECVHALAAAGVRLPFAIEVVGFADEEGVRFGTTFLGSKAVAGTFDPAALEATDRDGVRLADAMRAFGLDPARIGEAAHPRGSVLAYAELHIEQGPVLEAEGLPVGVVTAIAGATRYRLEIEGVAGHAGTVPMRLRRDALAAAAECALAVESRAAADPDIVATVGILEALPGAMNVIPGLGALLPRSSLALCATKSAPPQCATCSRKCRRFCARRGVRLSATKLHDGAGRRVRPLDAGGDRRGDRRGRPRGAQASERRGPRRHGDARALRHRHALRALPLRRQPQPGRVR
ncbi:MAG: hydantoinase/carbamoylase family amidase [Burkholderiales bacterium]|nr:hydantoinase/carbamoylase family amidase [Burkholderiales bacterium]